MMICFLFTNCKKDNGNHGTHSGDNFEKLLAK